MAFFPSEGTEMIQPISMTVLGGLSFGSLMTLFVMPSLYYIFNAGNERKVRRINKKLKKLYAARDNGTGYTAKTNLVISKLENKKAKLESQDAEREANISAVAIEEKKTTRINKVASSEEDKNGSN